MRILILTAGLVLAGIMPAFAAMEDYPAAQLKALDKSTARTTTFEVPVGSTIQYGALYIKLQACRKSDPIEKPESAAFLQVWELPPETEESRWVFSGWMFASSPALSAMDHPVYDVWVLGCTGKEEPPPPAPDTGDEAVAADAETAPAGESAEEAAASGDPASATPAPAAEESGEEILLD